MAKRGHRTDKKGRSLAESFILLQRHLTRSPAWKTMSPTAKAVLLDVWERHNGRNNGEISYSVREAEAIGVSRSAAARAFNELLQRGFLKVGRNSSFTLKTKEARTWELTAEPTGQEAGVKASRDYMTWSPQNQNTVPERASNGPAGGTQRGIAKQNVPLESLARD